MADDNAVLHERLKQLNEYINDLRELQQIDNAAVFGILKKRLDDFEYTVN